MSKNDFSAQGDAFLKNGLFPQAEQAYRLALKKEAAGKERNWIRLSSALLLQGKINKAEEALAEALDINEKNPEALINMARVMKVKNETLLAIGYLALAARAVPNDPVYKQLFLDIGGEAVFIQHNPEASDILVQCLRTPELHFRGAYPLWCTLLLTHPSFGAIYQMQDLAAENFDPAPLISPLFIEGLKKMLARNQDFERFIGRLRRWLLLGNGRETLAGHDLLCLSDALAVYCHRTDYIIFETFEEKEKIDDIEKKLIQGTEATPFLFNIYACYRPFTHLQPPVGFLETSDGIASLIREDKEMKALRGTIHTSAISDNISRAVQEQYEEFPYPRWDRIPLTAKERLPGIIEDLVGKHPKILVAGGGTGWEPLINAFRFPQAEITAIDLSLTSLSYAQMKAEQHDVKNISFKQMDILRLADSTDSYDLIASAGVLHHMKDPMAGWRILCDRLKPKGIMRIALYSKIARKNIAKTREVIVAENIGHDRESMLNFREKIADYLDTDVLQQLHASTDFYTLSTFRDLIFHVQEHQFDLPEIGKALDELGLEFIGFEEKATVFAAYHKEYPTDPQGKSLTNWHAFEQKKPHIFRGMYQFWCQKK